VPTASHLVTPAEKVDVDVADAPFLAVEMEEGSGREQSLSSAPTPTTSSPRARSIRSGS
jgi:hypothetical protein